MCVLISSSVALPLFCSVECWNHPPKAHAWRWTKNVCFRARSSLALSSAACCWPGFEARVGVQDLVVRHLPTVLAGSQQ